MLSILTTTCSRLDCTSEGEYVPVLSLSARNYNGPEATVVIHLLVCGEHSKVLTVDDLITDENWKQISDQFLRGGKVVPSRELTKLRFEYVE